MVKHMCSKPAVLGMAFAIGLGTAMAQTGTGTGTSAGTSAQGAANGATAAGQRTTDQMNSQMNSQAGSMSGMTGSGSASMQDKMFLKKATQGSNFEIKTAQLALQKSQNNDVKQFAQMMIDDHTKLNDQMAPVAQQAGVTPPTGISKKDQAIYDKLQGMNGTAFDQAYAKAMVKDHTMDSKEFKQEASSGQLPAEKTAAGQGAQVVDMHLQHAKQLEQTLGGNAGGGSSNGQ